MKLFNKICRMSQKTLKEYVTKQLCKTYDEVISDDGYVYAQGTFPVLLVAHMDTVHKELPSVVYYDKTTDALSSPEGIGGDDRCGIYMILKIIKKYNCSVLFCEDEEIGMVGAGKFVKTELAKSLKFNYMIEFDRKGKNDAVFYECDNPEFKDFITKEFYKTNFGTFSDISTLAPVIGCAAVNLSCGYYNAHTKNEYIIFSEMKNSIVQACKILDRTTENDVFEYIEAEYEDWYYGSTNAIEKYYVIEYEDEKGNTEWDDMMAVSDFEAVGKFLYDHDTLTMQHVVNVMCMDEMLMKRK